MKALDYLAAIWEASTPTDFLNKGDLVIAKRAVGAGYSYAVYHAEHNSPCPPYARLVKRAEVRDPDYDRLEELLDRHFLKERDCYGGSGAPESIARYLREHGVVAPR